MRVWFGLGWVGMERAMGFEPTTFCLGSKHSTTELRPPAAPAPAHPVNPTHPGPDCNRLPAADTRHFATNRWQGQPLSCRRQLF